MAARRCYTTGGKTIRVPVNGPMELITVFDWIKFAILSAAVAMLVGCSGSLQQLVEDTLPSKDAEYKSSRRLPPYRGGYL